ncbi:YciI family protein [Azospirillum sp. ST 5-10]|uniref:YciI family protein n=1 Tax=unclassified Azospirillum TaxID=2630922 RepID=UPI003F4A345C
MLYAIFCYDDEDTVFAYDKDEEAALMGRLDAVQRPLREAGRLGPVARLLPTTAATTVRKGRDALVIDGPYAETKEQLLGFYVVDVDTLEEALAFARRLAEASSGPGSYEVRPMLLFRPGADLAP